MLRLLGVRVLCTIERKESKKLALGALKTCPKQGTTSSCITLGASYCLDFYNLLFAAPEHSVRI